MQRNKCAAAAAVIGHGAVSTAVFARAHTFLIRNDLLSSLRAFSAKKKKNTNAVVCVARCVIVARVIYLRERERKKKHYYAMCVQLRSVHREYGRSSLPAVQSNGCWRNKLQLCSVYDRKKKKKVIKINYSLVKVDSKLIKLCILLVRARRFFDGYLFLNFLILSVPLFMTTMFLRFLDFWVRS